MRIQLDENESLPTCWDEVEEGDCVRDAQLTMVVGFVIGGHDPLVASLHKKGRTLMFRDGSQFYGWSGQRSEWMG